MVAIVIGRRAKVLANLKQESTDAENDRRFRCFCTTRTDDACRTGLRWRAVIQRREHALGARARDSKMERRATARSSRREAQQVASPKQGFRQYSYDDVSGTGAIVDVTGGWAIDLVPTSKAQFCPLVGFSYQNGPNISSSFGDVSVSAHAFGIGGALGGVAIDVAWI
jgi:hypothetical protein